MKTGSHPRDEEMLKKLGARIKALRIRKGFKNYEKFANAYDLNRSQIWRYENGVDLNFTSLLKVIRAFDMSLSEFFSEGFEE